MGKVYRKEVDLLLKDIIKNPPRKFVFMLSGKYPSKLLDTELPYISNKRADFVIELEDKSILHLEFQSFNDPAMAERMFDYNFLIYKKTGNPRIKQYCIYVGNEKLKMKNSISFEDFEYRYNLLDIRELNCMDLVLSDNLEDKLLAALCNIKDPKFYINHMKEVLEQLPRKEREDKVYLLIEIMKLRDILKEGIKKYSEERNMPIRVVIDLDEVVNDPWLGEIAKMAIQKGEQLGMERGMQKGMEQGLQQGLQQGLIKDAQDMVLTAIETKLGYIPDYVSEKIKQIENHPYLKDLLKKIILSSDLEKFLKEEFNG
ncbi:MAG: hypothetical protein N2Z81_07425 [Hydrogenothermaceae bacterium]|nr:hypothetical protein [Hydrogenothermaceae bacterium]